MGKKSRAKREQREGGRVVKMNPEMQAALQQQIVGRLRSDRRGQNQ